MKMLKFTSPDDSPVWIALNSISRVRPTSPGDGVKGGAIIWSNAGMQVVQEKPEVIIAAIRETA